MILFIKKYWIQILVASILVTILIVRDINNDKQIKALEIQLKQSQESVFKERLMMNILTKKMIGDSINYEREKQHIQKLRDRYPNDALLDSLVRAGQSID